MLGIAVGGEASRKSIESGATAGDDIEHRRRSTGGRGEAGQQVTGRPNVIVFSGSFHGRSHLTMAMTTSKHGYRAGYAPLPAGVFVAPFPHPWREGVSEEDVGRARADRAAPPAARRRPRRARPRRWCSSRCSAKAGTSRRPASFLRGVQAICREHGILFVADEVQTGFARTGTMFAIEQADVVPDVIVMAKGIASGFPISAIGASAELMARWPKGSHGGTYGGNPIGCAAALATIDVLTEPGFLDAVNARGEQLRSGLERIVARPRAARPRCAGPGSWSGSSSVTRRTGTHDSARIGQVIARCREDGHAAADERGDLRQRRALHAAARRDRGRDRPRLDASTPPSPPPPDRRRVRVRRTA